LILIILKLINVIFYIHLRTNMFKKFVLLILIIFSGFCFWNYTYNTNFSLKNQNTIVKFLKNNKFSFEFDCDLSDKVFNEIFKSEYNVSGYGDVYYLNNNVAGFVNLGFDYLAFQQLSLSFLIDDSDLFFRITNNSFENILDFEFLGNRNWQRIDLNELSFDIYDLNIFKYIALSDNIDNHITLQPSEILRSEYDNFWIHNLTATLGETFLNSNQNFLNFRIDASYFSGQIPISRPGAYVDFAENLL